MLYPNRFDIITRKLGTEIWYAIRDKSKPMNDWFTAQFKVQRDAVEFIALIEAREEKLRAIQEHIALEDMIERNKEMCRLLINVGLFHNQTLATNPPQDAWVFHGMDQKIADVIAKNLPKMKEMQYDSGNNQSSSSHDNSVLRP
jgi:hypothetical protein